MSKQDFAESTIKGQQSLLEVINQYIGQIPVHEIKPTDILKVCQIYEKQEKLETAKKVKVKCGQILRYAVSIGLCERDVTQDLKGALKTPKVTHMAALVEPKDFALLLQDIDHYEGSAITRYALRIAPLVFVFAPENSDMPNGKILILNKVYGAIHHPRQNLKQAYSILSRYLLK
ncbi:putative prophage CPS-53 integrase [compost metagenome]